MPLTQHPTGDYRFLPLATDSLMATSAPFSRGVVAMPGYEIVHAIFQTPLPYRQGFAAAERHLSAQGRTRTALCAVELRCPEPYTLSGFGAFNQDYRALLMEWGVFVEGQNPIARSNIAPSVNPPTETLLYAFSYTAPTTERGQTFVVSGAPEKATVRPGETSPDALQEKTGSVMLAMQASLAALETDWAAVTALNLYTEHDLHAFLPAEILAAMGPAVAHGKSAAVGKRARSCVGSRKRAKLNRSSCMASGRSALAAHKRSGITTWRQRSFPASRSKALELASRNAISTVSSRKALSASSR